MTAASVNRCDRSAFQRGSGLKAVRLFTATVVGSCLVLAASGGCKREGAGRPAPESTGAWFTDVTAESNVDFRHVFAVRQKHYFPEIMSGGVALLDYDNDGNLDLYFIQGGDLDKSIPNRPGNRMYRNRGDGTFEDVTVATGTGDTGYGMGCACGDYDRDGDVDLYVTNVGPNVLYRNNGDGTFTDVTQEAGVADPAWGTSAAFVDYDGDGWLDLFIVNYVDWTATRELKCKSRLDQKDYCHPSSYQAPTADSLYRNLGDGTFANVSQPSGIGVASGDFNADGRLDFFVANDAMPNQLWLNQGDGRFVDDALMAGCALNHSGASEGGMGVMAVDFDYDGDLDLFVSHLRDESNTLYVNSAGLFTDTTPALGLEAPSLAFTGFGLGFADFDHDGLLDVFVANGRVTLIEPIRDATKPYGEENQLFAGQADGRFVEVLPRGGTPGLLPASSRGAAFGDIDNDGDIDIVIANRGTYAHLLRNDAGVRGNWIMFRVLGERGIYAIGADVRIDVAGTIQSRRVQRAYSYCSSNDPRVHFGLSQSERIDKVTVRWPDGSEETFGPFSSNQIIELRKEAGTARPVQRGSTVPPP